MGGILTDRSAQLENQGMCQGLKSLRGKSGGPGGVRVGGNSE